MTQDNRPRAPAFAPGPATPAHGLTPTVKGNLLAVHTFACGRCHKPSQQAGRGYRMVCGGRVQVCAACKAFIDSRRARAAA